ncbi:MAG TPA: hypothetical protein VNJ54_08385 [Plantibacter sp.]|nr:hypothetical protein [Plantibacter sp.]
MTFSLVLRIVAVWFAVSVPFSLAVGAWLHACSPDDDNGGAA